MNLSRRSFLRGSSAGALALAASPRLLSARGLLTEPKLDDLIQRTLAAATKAGATYADVRIVRIRRENVATREDRVERVTSTEDYGVDVQFSLVEIATNKSVMTGTTFSHVSYDLPGSYQRFARSRAFRDAEDRAAEEVADQHHDLAPPVGFAFGGGDHVGARGFLCIGRHGVLEIEDQGVGIAIDGRQGGLGGRH